jgi:PAS domain S-box-containing protein
MKIVHQGFILVAVPLVIEICFGIALLMHIYGMEEAIKDQARFAKLSGALTITNGIIQETFFQAGFYAIDKDKKYSDGMRNSLKEVESNIGQTRSIFLEDPKLAAFQASMDDDWVELRKALMALGDEENKPKRSRNDKIMIVALVQEKTTEIRRTMETALRNLQRDALDAAERTEKSKVALRATLVVGLAFNVIVAGVLLLYFSKNTSERLKRITQNSIRLARGDELEPPVGGSDEIATLDDVFHQVADVLRTSADRERAVFENAVDVICSLDGDGRMMRVNKAFFDLTGTEAELAVENHVMEYVTKDDQEKAYEFLLKAKRESDSNHSIEIGMRTEEGAVRDVLWSIKWDSGERSYFLVMHDITDRKELERAKQEFVNMISHDLRSPLTSLKVTLDLFLNGVFGDQTSKATARLQAMDESITRLIRLISDLLDVEKFEAGQMQLNVQPTDAKQIVEIAVDSVHGMAEAQKVELKAIPNNMTVSADADRIVQVLVNLISNAIKFSPPNSTVEVRSLVRDGFGEFRVIDKGRGIPASHVNQVFERFKQVDIKDSTEKKGTGLGLAICKNIVEAHGGTIGVDSEAGVGSQFWFRLRLG